MLQNLTIGMHLAVGFSAPVTRRFETFGFAGAHKQNAPTGGAFAEQPEWAHSIRA